MNQSYPIRVLAISCLILAAGCSTTKTPPPSSQSQAQPNRDLMMQAQQSQEPQRSLLLLQAAQGYEAKNDVAKVAAVLAQIDSSKLPTAPHEQYVLLAARNGLAQHNGGAALEALQQAQPPLFVNADLATRQTLSNLRAQAYDIQGDYLQSAKEQIFSSGLYSGDAYQEHLASIWPALTKVPTTDLQTAAEEASEPTLKGWLSLALTMQQHSDNLDDQIQALRDWKAQWPQHPAAQHLPAELSLLQQLSQQKPHHIALTLPLSGPFAAAGMAIRDGFLGAYYTNPRRATEDLRVTIFDTTQYPDYSQLYAQLEASGYDLVVGPLEKANLNQLVKTQSPMQLPVLALNYADTPIAANQPIYQIALAVEDEAEQAAEQAWQQGAHKAAIVITDSPWGQRALQSFRDTWTHLGGEVAGITYLRSDSDFSQLVSEMVGTDDSKNRARELSRTLGQHLKFEPRIRQDLNCILMAATPVAARQIKPLMAFHYAGQVPVYATSQVFTGHINANSDLDLDGIKFVDLPWALEPNNPLKTAMLTNWPEQANERLYGLGADAYMLAPRIDIIQQIPNISINGMTGTISLGEDHKLKRQLPWAIFKQGVPQLLDSAPATSP